MTTNNLSKMYVALAFLSMSLGACINPPSGSDLKSEVTIPNGAVDYFEKGINFGYEGGDIVMSFNVNLKWDMKISNTQNGVQWLTIDKTVGSSGNNKVTFTAQENPTYEDRSVVVQFIAGDTVRNIKVNQKRLEAITLTADVFEVPADGGYVGVEVNHSADYSFTIPDNYKSWIHMATNATRGLLDTEKITFTIEPSDEYDKREGKIYFTSRDEEEVVTIYQAGEGKLVLSQNEYNLTGSEQEFTIDVSSNFDFGMTLPEVDWLQENKSQTRGMSSHQLKFKVTKNEDYNSRSAKIKLFDNNNKKFSEEIVINQASIGAIISLDSTIYNIGSEKQDLDIEVKSNFDYNVDFQGATWIKQRAKTRGVSSKLLKLSVEENKGFEARTAKIKLYDKNSEAYEEITINQLPSTPTIVPEKTEYEVDAKKQNLDIKISSNVDYVVDFQGADWITDRNVKTRALATSTLRLAIAQNDSYDSRTAKIKLYDNNSSASEEITITQKAKSGIDIPTTSFTVDELGGQVKVVVNSNVDYKFTISDECKDWIKQASNTRGLEAHEHTLTIDALGDAANREGTITISNEDMKFSKTVTIKQYQSFGFDKSEANVLIGKEHKITLNNLTDDVNIEWTSSNESIATVDNNGVVKGVSKGEATITAKTADGKHTATCKITVCEIKDLINVYNSGGVVSVVNNVVQYGSKLNWTFSNGSPEKVTLKSLQLIDGQTNEAGNEMSVNKEVKAGTSVNYSTTIGAAGIHLPVTCRYKFEYDGVTYTKDAKYEGTSN